MSLKSLLHGYLLFDHPSDAAAHASSTTIRRPIHPIASNVPRFSCYAIAQSRGVTAGRGGLGPREWAAGDGEQIGDFAGAAAEDGGDVLVACFVVVGEHQDLLLFGV